MQEKLSHLSEYISIEDYHARLSAGKITCREVVQQYLQRINETKKLNAFVEVFANESLQRATQLDEQRKQEGLKGKLHGVVIALKDVISYKGHSLTAASHILENFKAVYSATAVEKLLDAGAIIIGNCNCDEFAMGSTNENSAYGKVLNALDESRVPGGSSGGSAVAVQAGLCMVSLGSDTGGSVRQPADFCGIVGLKPSYGRVSRYGLIAYASSFDQIGIFGTNISDVARVLEVIAGKDEYDSTVSQTEVPVYASQLHSENKYKFAYFEEALHHAGIDGEIATSIKSKIEALKKEGHTVEAVPFELMDFVVPAYYILTTAEASSNLSRYDGVKFGHRTKTQGLNLHDTYRQTRTEGFGKEVKRRIMLGTFVLSAGYYDAYFTKAQQVRRLLQNKIQDIFNNYDFIILPTSPVTAFKAGEKMDDPIAMYLADIYTVMANLIGIPAISLPIFKHSNGMPFGMQLMANSFDELTLLQVSHQMMKPRL